MLVANYAKTLTLIRAQFKLVILSCIVISIVLLILVNLLVGTKYLDPITSAQLLERYVSLIGILLLTPMFFPEQDKDISEVVEAKYMSHLKIVFGRLILSLVVLAFLVSMMLLVLKIGECEFPYLKYLLGTCISALALGSLGFFGAGVTNNVIVGYMISLCYYILNHVLKEKLGHFFLFSMGRGSFEEKYYLFIAAVVLIGLTFLINYIRYKKR